MLQRGTHQYADIPHRLLLWVAATTLGGSTLCMPTFYIAGRQHHDDSVLLDLPVPGGDVVKEFETQGLYPVCLCEDGHLPGPGSPPAATRSPLP